MNNLSDDTLKLILMCLLSLPDRRIVITRQAREDFKAKDWRLSELVDLDSQTSTYLALAELPETFYEVSRARIKRDKSVWDVEEETEAYSIDWEPVLYARFAEEAFTKAELLFYRDWRVRPVHRRYTFMYDEKMARKDILGETPEKNEEDDIPF